MPVIFKRQRSSFKLLPHKLFSHEISSLIHSSLCPGISLLSMLCMICHGAVLLVLCILSAVICGSLNFSEFAEMSKKITMFNEIFFSTMKWREQL